MRTTVALLLVISILASGFLLTSSHPAAAQFSPSTPSFTLKFDNESYDVPATGSTAGYHVDKEFIDVVIKNSNEYSYYAVVNESLVRLYFNIRVKDHSNTWTNCTVSPNLAPSDSNYTTVKFGLGSTNPDPGGFSIWIGNITDGNLVDFQVRALLGFYTKLTQQNPPCWRLPQYSVFNETGASDWSNIQTLGKADASISTVAQTPLPTTSPTAVPASGINPTTITLGIIVVAVAASVVALMSIRKIRKHNGEPSQSGEKSV